MAKIVSTARGLQCEKTEGQLNRATSKVYPPGLIRRRVSSSRHNGTCQTIPNMHKHPTFYVPASIIKRANPRWRVTSLARGISSSSSSTSHTALLASSTPSSGRRDTHQTQSIPNAGSQYKSSRQRKNSQYHDYL